MEYRVFLSLNEDNELAKALKERVESPNLGIATGFTHQGVSYSIGTEGVSVKLDAYATEIPDAYKDMVKKIVLKAHIPSCTEPALGTYRRRRTTASVDSYVTGGVSYRVIMVEGPELGLVNRLFSDIRTGKATRARRAKWGTTPDAPQQ